MPRCTRNAILFPFALAILWCFGKSAGAQNLVQNPGFETGNFTGWTLISPQTLTVVKQTTTPFPAENGSFYASFGDFFHAASLTQTLSTVVGQHYSLDYFLANFNTTGTSNEFTVSVGGNLLADLVNIHTQTPYQDHPVTFTATGTSTVLQFTGIIGNPQTPLSLDNVSVTPIPEASALVTVMLALIPLAWFVRYRRKQVH